MADDFPAAHSMDTVWYAVDRDGHVAQFSSGEAGAVPLEAADPESITGLRELPVSVALVDHEGRSLPGPLSTAARHYLDGMGERLTSGLLFVRDMATVQAALTAGHARQVPSVTGVVAVIVNSGARALIEKLHKDGLCLCCFWHWEDEEDEEESSYDLAGQRGFFVYGHLCENWISGPYGRESVPQQPLHIDQLPPALRRAIGQCKLDVSFRTEPFIQPVDHGDCVSWEAAYLSGDGKKIGPIRGNPANDDDNQYREFYEELAQQYEGKIEVEPPEEE